MNILAKCCFSVHFKSGTGNKEEGVVNYYYDGPGAFEKPKEFNQGVVLVHKDLSNLQESDGWGRKAIICHSLAVTTTQKQVISLSVASCGGNCTQCLMERYLSIFNLYLKILFGKRK